MARQPRRLAGLGASDLPTAAAFDAYVGPAREVTVDPVREIIALHNGSTPGGKQIKISQDAPNLSDYFRGFTYGQNAAQPASMIDIAPGACRDAANALTISLGASIMKNVTQAFATGNGNGALDTGAVANGFYWLHAIWNPTTNAADILSSLSLNSPVLPSGYTSRRVIGGFAYIGGIRDFVSVGEWHYYKLRHASVSNQPNGTLAALRQLAVPAGAKLEVQLYVQANDSTSVNFGWVTVRDPDLGPYGGTDQADWFYPAGQFVITRAFGRTDNLGRVSSGDNNSINGNGRITIHTEGWKLDRSVYR